MPRLVETWTGSVSCSTRSCAAVAGRNRLERRDCELGGYEHVPSRVQRDLGGGEDPPTRPHPKSPSRRLWDTDGAAGQSPRLAEEYHAIRVEGPAIVLHRLVVPRCRLATRAAQSVTSRRCRCSPQMRKGELASKASGSTTPPFWTACAAKICIVQTDFAGTTPRAMMPPCFALSI